MNKVIIILNKKWTIAYNTEAFLVSVIGPGRDNCSKVLKDLQEQTPCDWKNGCWPGSQWFAKFMTVWEKKSHYTMYRLSRILHIFTHTFHSLFIVLHNKAMVFCFISPNVKHVVVRIYENFLMDLDDILDCCDMLESTFFHALQLHWETGNVEHCLDPGWFLDELLRLLAWTGSYWFTSQPSTESWSSLGPPRLTQFLAW